MMWKEFEEIAGYEVSYDTYADIIEPMYNALPEDIDKYQFVKMLDKKAFALPSTKELLRDIKKEAKHLYDICGRYNDYDSEGKMVKLAHEYLKRKYNIDWNKDSSAYCYFEMGYEYDNMRGCSYPKTLIIGKGNNEFERIALIKED